MVDDNDDKLEYDIEAPITSKVVGEMPNDSLLAEMLSLYRKTTPPPRCFRSPIELLGRAAWRIR